MERAVGTDIDLTREPLSSVTAPRKMCASPCAPRLVRRAAQQAR
jgi:hypothetical protein